MISIIFRNFRNFLWVCDFFRDLWKANFHKKKTYSLGIMKLFSFSTQMRQLGKHQNFLISFFLKNLKNTRYCLDFYEYGKL